MHRKTYSGVWIQAVYAAKVCLMVAAAMAMPRAVLAQEDGQATPSQSDETSNAVPEEKVELERPAGEDWTIQFEPILWFAAMQGNITATGGTSFDVEALDMDETEFAPAGRFTLRADEWRFRFSGFGFGIHDDHSAKEAVDLGAFTLARGDRVDIDLKYSSFKLTGGRRFFTVPIGRGGKSDDVVEPGSFEDDVEVYFSAYGGLRFYDVDLEFTNSAGVSSHNDGQWVEPLLGVALTIELPYRTGIDFYADGGVFGTGDVTSSSFDIGTSFHWQATRNAGLEVGFRHLSVDLQDHDFEFDTALAGLYGAIVIRF